jgi:sec-independent protein translocase protein TatB
MFDITSSKLLILAIVALIVVGPKDLPILLRTVGKYLGVIRRHAAEFRAQLDEALREAELDELKKEFESVGQEMKTTIAQGSSAIDSHVETARLGIDAAREGVAPEAQAGANGDKAEAAPEAGRAEKTGT